MPHPALGLIETTGIDGAIKATRAASGAGQVVIVSAEQGTAGRMTVKIEGEWAAVQSAVEAGARAAHEVGELVSMHVIPKSDDEVTAILPYPRFVGRYRPEEGAAAEAKTARAKARPCPAQPVSVREKVGADSASKMIAKTTSGQTEPKPAPAQPARRPEPQAPSEQPSWEQLQAMAVVKLRRYARTISELPIKGRQISIANKEQLLEAIAAVRPERA